MISNEKMRDALKELESTVTATLAHQPENDEKCSQFLYDALVKVYNIADLACHEARDKCAAPAVNGAKLREADHNWDAICEKCLEGEPPDECRYYGEPNGCNSPMYGEHPKPFGENAGVLRSAIIEILLEMEDMSGLEVGRKYKFSPDAIAQQCRDALAAPARNCDVLSAQEQAKRWKKFCSEHHKKWIGGKIPTGPCECPCYEGNSCNHFLWAQMPYASKATPCSE